ncbi:MAG: ABC-F family ATP-binding cassette domain-containing protein [Microthrixaceae bacterium]
MIRLDATGLAASRPGRPLFAGVSLTVSDGDRWGVVGLNGCGKSTLLGILAGTVEPEDGTVRRGRDTRLAVLGQDPDLDGPTVRATLDATAGVEPWEAAAVADRLGLGPLLDESVGRLSGGQAKRVALARALVTPSDVLILDEPTNHLDIDAIAWLEDRLVEYRGGLVLVTHDRHFLDRVTNRVLELDRGEGFVHEGGYDAYLEGRALRAEREARAEDRRRNLARTELAWLRRGAPARTSKPKARIESATAVVEGRARTAARPGDLPLHHGTPRLGDRVIELHGVGHRFVTPDGDEGPWLFRGLDLLLDPRERLGIVGVNGSGKSTLLDVMARRIEPVEGRVEHGTTARVGVYDQRGRHLDPAVRVREALTGPHREADWRDAALLEAFWFDEDAQWAPVGLLSGGERRRLQLLLVLAEQPNVLLLDEPTNDLDLDTLRQLEDFLEDWPGALVVVSHDRAFLERTVADAVVLDGAGSAGRRPGGYAAYEAERRAVRSPRRTGATGASVPARGAAAPAGPRGSAGRAAPSGGSGPSPSTLRHRLRAAEREVASLQERHDDLAERVARAGTEGDHATLTEAGRELGEVTDALAVAEEAWLELAAQAEERGLHL